MDFIKNKTAKLRSLGKRLLTRRAINRIAPAPVEELAALDPTAPALSPRRVSLSPRTKRQRSKASRKIQSRIRGKQTRKVINREKNTSTTVHECSICFEPLTRDVRIALPCGHRFHKDCIRRSLTSTSGRCPNCRSVVTNIPYPSIQEQEPELPQYLRTRISMPTSNINNTTIVNTVNALIAGLPNAATMDEAVSLINETEVLIHNLPHNERAVLREARNQVLLQQYPRLQQAPRQSRATTNAIDRANALIDNMSRATTYNEAVRYMDAATIEINSLPRNGYAYRQLSNRQWATWLQAYNRTALQ
jgi:hypothetical protein